MDGLSLLRRASDAGLRVEAAGDKLLIRGPKRAEPLVKLLAQHKPVVLAALALAPGFARVVPTDGEPGLEEPCTSRRGRVQVLDGAFLHFCVECGRFGAFGYGVCLRAGHTGRWYCGEHRPRSVPADHSRMGEDLRPAEFSTCVSDPIRPRVYRRSSCVSGTSEPTP
jgi:hypothetical protein